MSWMLVTVKKDGCGACKILSTIWSEVIIKLRASNVSFTEFAYTFPDRTQQLRNAPSALSSNCYAPWFPFIMLVPIESWNDALKDRKIKMFKTAHVMNGVIIDVNTCKESLIVNLRSSDAIVGWVKDITGSQQIQPPLIQQVISQPTSRTHNSTCGKTVKVIQRNG